MVILMVATRSVLVEGLVEGLYLVSNADSSSVLLVDTTHGHHFPFIRSGTFLDHPDAMMYHPLTGRLLVSSGSNLSHSAILQFDALTGAYLGRFDDGTPYYFCSL